MLLGVSYLVLLLVGDEGEESGGNVAESGGDHFVVDLNQEVAYKADD